MNSFYASAATTTPPTDSGKDSIHNDGWFPAIAMAEARDSARIDSTVTDVRLKDALIAAMLEVNTKLRHWKAVQVSVGYSSIRAVPAPTVDQISTLVILYKRAVYSAAKADLMERYRDIDTTADGHKKAEMMNASIEEQRRNSQWAIADIEGRTRVTVDLI